METHREEGALHQEVWPDEGTMWQVNLFFLCRTVRDQSTVRSLATRISCLTPNCVSRLFPFKIDTDQHVSIPQE